MKTLLTPIAALLLATGLLAGAATNDLSGLLQKGLFEEEANRNLDAAISAYQSLTKAFDQDRRLAATAVFRLGECYRKLGKTNEAVASYERILRDFADETTLATLSRQNLAGLGVKSPSGAVATTLDARLERRLLEERIQLAEKALEETKRRFEGGFGAKVEVADKEKELARLRQELVTFDASPAPALPIAPAISLAARQQQAKLLSDQIALAEQDVTEARKQFESGVVPQAEVRAKERAVLGLRQQLAALDVTSAEASEADRTVSGRGNPQSPEARELARLLQIHVQLQGVDFSQLRKLLPTLIPDADFERLERQLTQAEDALAQARTAEETKEAAVQRESAFHAAQERGKTIMDLLAKWGEVLDARVKEQQAAQGTNMLASAAQTTAVVIDEEVTEIRRLQAMIQNSPDLINAASGEDKLTPLCRAAGRGQLNVAGYLLVRGADVNLNRPLHSAASAGHKAMVELLLARGANVNAVDGNSMTALHQAASKGFLSVTEALLAAKADPNLRDVSNQTPLNLAAKNGFRPVAAALLARGADPNVASRVQPNSGQNSIEQGRAMIGTPLHLAAARGDTALAALLLTNRADVTAQSIYGETPLQVAAARGKADVVELLLSAGADPNARNNSDTTSALHLAVGSGSAETVKALLARGAKPNVTTAAGQQGVTPLMQAASAGSEEIVALLLLHQADPNFRNGQGDTALILAINQGRAAVVKALLKGATDANLRNAPGYSPLILAVANPRSKDMAAALIEARADLEAVSPDGKTALHYALDGGDGEMVALLLKSGANPNARNPTGNTPLHLAISYKRAELADQLLAAKADPNLRNNDGLTPLDLATGKSASPRLASPGVALPPPGPRLIAPGVSPTPPPATPTALADLLRQHGAVADLPKLDRIEVRRPGSDFTEVVCLKGTNDWNRFTVMEALLAVFRGGKPVGPSGREQTEFEKRLATILAREPSMSGRMADLVGAGGAQTDFQKRLLTIIQNSQGTALPFPDLRRLTIVRPGATPAAPPQRILVNLLNAKGEVDCTKDVPLQFGDVLEIPEREHTLQEAAVGLTPEQAAQIAECRKGTVNLMVRGKATPLTVWPVAAEATLGRLLARPEARAALFSNSDLSRVKVIRKAGPPAGEWVLDCASGSAPDLWLRDGDVIEVPER